LTDAELVAGLGRREPRAFTVVYERYQVRIYSFLVRLCGSRPLADDLFQETFLQLARHAPELRPDTELGAWLYTVARNRYRSYRRTSVLRKLRLQLAQLGGAAGRLDTPAAPATPFEHAAHSDLGRQLEQALAQLGDAQREVLLLVGVEGLEQDRAAAILGLTPAALRQRLARARAQVQEFLAKSSSDPESAATRNQRR
jgi:RNA polymerase sigma-70 factor (ECF subfamily)